MSKQANPVAIGGFVLGALVLVVIAILVFSSGALFQEKHQYVTYFPGTVQGLDVGSAVQFKGVKIGQVTGISLDYRTEDSRFSIPVYYETWSDRLRIIGEDPKTREEVKATFKHLIEEQGLRARLQSVSMVTGQYMINLDLYPDTPVNYAGVDRTVIEVPAITATRDRVESMLADLKLDDLVNKAIAALGAIERAAEDEALHSLVTNANETLVEVRELIADIDAGMQPVFKRVDDTLAGYSGLANTAEARVTTLADSIERTSADIGKLSQAIEKKVGPVSGAAQGAFNQAKQTLQSVDGLVGEESASRYDLELLLKEAAGAARSLRMLADYLEQHPDAIIKGKYR